MRLLFISLLFTLTLSADRCVAYVQQVRVAHSAVFGIDFPYWYGVGQIKQESGCRDIISRDGVGSQGVAQITYRIWQKYLDQKGIYNIDSIGNQLHAQAYIMQNAKQQAYSSHLWAAYQLYNGGGLINKEIMRARKALHITDVSHDQAHLFCKRKIVHFNNGQTRSACDINYDYSKRIYKYGQEYKTFDTKKYKFW
ncbi:MAG: hypothetical protein R3331_09315 [Sulfurospirillaceae bacterium]|nr:hypothetical protein [Sulfurospirillaceae bacterium]